MTLALIAWGIVSLIHLPIDAVPDITNNQVQVITTTPTLATQEVEQFVTAPIERSMGNLPDIVEIRSVSRFGLSVVTIVFEDKTDIYFARQLVDQKLNEAEEEIPPGVGKPEMAPVSTGLGEIYQYVLHPAEGFENAYSAMDLRSMQDWIVARQLTGTPGVAEVNSFGGYLKQYEVAIDPLRLKALNITIPEIFDALEKNNENTGGAYIEKQQSSYYIRGIGVVTGIEDIGKIVVKTNDNGVPVMIRDVAHVDYGYAPRYGAQTRNGQGEVVGGIVMMLKGENSAEVVNRVKERMATIQQSLPEGVVIDAYLDRTSLVNRSIKTVETNLLEGALIVIFILVIFLGNLRAGLIVASVIPLAMLFAVAMMRLFGISGNLMSLGAIDFGLIVDGAVIIVESILHRIAQHNHNSTVSKKMSASQMDKEVYESASRMMNSATFGQIIILIVYLPILALRGIEGKMFGPMAQTVGFAIIGALILSLTYVPMMSALFLSKRTGHRKNFSDRMMNVLQAAYQPAIEFAIRFKVGVVTVSIILFAGAVMLFNSLGGEFIPTLEEGDFAFHSILPQGSSLSESVKNNERVEKIIMRFPEVKEVIAKTGSAEVPTDPMPPEATDMIIILKDKSEWTTTNDFWELADTIMRALQEVPGVFFEINQPIQMRFNELMTGVRQDIAVKLFGENLDTLLQYANLIAEQITTIEGAGTPQVEKIDGLPQITIAYDRTRLAQYDVNISDVNKIITAAFAGAPAGVVFENERRYDIVVRLDSAYRKDITDVENLFVPLPNGGQIPLQQVAEVNYKLGPAQISRENGKRRIVTGLNVTDRDVQSVVEDIQKQIEANIKLPAGYYTTYGGQFENLQEATKRLTIAVPVALLLILILLYFTFGSLKQALLIYSAIPLSAIGGVVALWMRDMPFSISAGVGFIALFGVAVLNGIVLISTFNQLEKEGVDNVYERVRKGTMIRLRPVLMTASVASLGFLPMALSHSAGAEVQRPLATVVIGGLISATALTLLVLPALYILFTGKRKINMSSSTPVALLVIAVLLISNTTSAQQITTLPVDSVVSIALRNNPQIQSAQLDVEKNQYLKKTSFDLPKTGIFIENEDILEGENDGVLKVGIEQGIAFPGVYIAKSKIGKEQIMISETQLALTKKELVKQVTEAYYNLLFLVNKKQLLQTQDSLYASYEDAAKRKYTAGETNQLEKISAEAKRKEIHLAVENAAREVAIAQNNLQQLMRVDFWVLPDANASIQLSPNPSTDLNHPLLLYYNQQIDLAGYQSSLAKANMLPDLNVRYFNQNLLGIDPGYRGYSIGIGIPLAFWSYTAQIKAANTQQLIAEKDFEHKNGLFTSAYAQLRQQYEIASATKQYYETTGLLQADEILHTAYTTYDAGDIGYFELMYAIDQYFNIRFNYLQSVADVNQIIAQLNYFHQPE